MRGISPLLIEDYKRKRKGEVSGATVNRELSCLKHMLHMALDEGILTSNPVKKVRYFPERNSLFRILTPIEKQKLIENSQGYLQTVVIIALNTGMRRGEILSLKWSQVDFERHFINVDRSKSGKPRAIPMNSLVKDSLIKLSQAKLHEQFIFLNSSSKMPIQDIRKVFSKALVAAKIGKLRFHDLRHNFASALVEKGVDIVTVSELLGHSNINLTAKRYSHPSPQHKRLAVESLLPQNEQKSIEILPGLLPDRIYEAVN